MNLISSMIWFFFLQKKTKITQIEIASSQRVFILFGRLGYGKASNFIKEFISGNYFCARARAARTFCSHMQKNHHFLHFLRSTKVDAARAQVRAKQNNY